MPSVAIHAAPAGTGAARKELTSDMPSARRTRLSPSQVALSSASNRTRAAAGRSSRSNSTSSTGRPSTSAVTWP
jgi:hypothetical protein